MDKVFLLLLHNVLNAVLGIVMQHLCFRVAAATLQRVVRISEKFSSTNPLYEKIRLFNIKLCKNIEMCKNKAGIFTEFMLIGRHIFCTITSDSVFHTILNTEMYKKPDKAYFQFHIFTKSKRKNTARQEEKNPIKILYY